MEKPETTISKSNDIQKEVFDRLSGMYRLDSLNDAIEHNRSQKAIPTGFVNLDNVLDGGLYPGLYVMGAISSLGKTTFAMQITDQIARFAQKDCLVFALEMSAHELMARSISRLTNEFGRNNKMEKKTTRGILDGSRYEQYTESERALIDRAKLEYGLFSHRVFIVEGNGDIGVGEIERYAYLYRNFYKKSPVIIVDYMQIMPPINPRATDKQNADMAISAMKRISRDFETPVIVISSFNRDNYKMQVNMAAFKESGAIEYSSDVLLGLQLKGVKEKDFDVDAAKDKDPREIECVVLKNRNGKTGKTIAFYYDAKFNSFCEMPDEEKERNIY